MKVSPFVAGIVRTNSEIRVDRAVRFSKALQNASEAHLTKCRAEVSDKELVIERMMDFGPSNTLDLTVASSNENAVDMIEKIHRAQVDLRLARIELDIAEYRHEEWFGTEVDIEE